jgi:hypothetical protein
MIRLIVANTAQADAVGAAARAAGVAIRSRPFIASDLERLKQPALIVFDAERAPDLTPDLLQTLRRTLGGAVRYSPALVFTGGDKRSWFEAGVIALGPGVGAHRIRQAIEICLASDRDWVTSSAYVGPSRRQHRAFLPLSRRRAEDRSTRKGAGRALPTPAPSASLGVLTRRVAIGVTLLTGSTIETRRAFKATVEEMQASAHAHGRSDLHGPIAVLLHEADAFVLDARRDNAAAERAAGELAERADA